MIVLLHVSIAIASILLTSYAYVRPSVSKLRTSYVSIGMTLLSGFYLVWIMPSHMIQACMSGVLYLAVVTAGIVVARHKLAERVKQA